MRTKWFKRQGSDVELIKPWDTPPAWMEDPEIEYDERPPTKHKVWFHTYWYGRGPIYTYNGSKLPGRISRAWFTHVDPPYYRGTGIAIRLINTTIRFGICYPQGRIFADEFEETIAEMERGLGAVPLKATVNEDKEPEVREVPLTPEQQSRIEAERKLWAERLAERQQSLRDQ